MIGIGIEQDDRLSFINKKCAIKDTRNRDKELNEVLSCTAPDALISHEAAKVFADQLCKNLGCTVSVMLVKEGFEITFLSAPVKSQITSASTYQITTAMLDDIRHKLHPDQERQPILVNIAKHLNEAGAKAIRWFLLRIHMEPHDPKQDPFVLKYGRLEASWTPPPKPTGYEPLRGKHSSTELTGPATKRSIPPLSSK